VRLDETFGDRQAEPGAAIGARRSRLGLPERLQRPLLFLLVHADAVIFDLEYGDFRPVGHNSHPNGAAFFRELDRVGEKVEKDLLHRTLVRPDIHLLLRHLSDQLDIAAARALVNHAHDLADQALHRNNFLGEFYFACFDLRHVEYIIDNRQQMKAAGMNIPDIFEIFLVRDRTEELVGDHFGKPDYGIQWGAQLVAHIGEKVTLRAVGQFGLTTGFDQFSLRRPNVSNVRIDRDHRAVRHCSSADLQ